MGLNIIISITEKTNKKAEAHTRELRSQFSAVTTTLSSTHLCARVQEVLNFAALYKDRHNLKTEDMGL